jgi:hypothetical protein
MIMHSRGALARIITSTRCAVPGSAAVAANLSTAVAALVDDEAEAQMKHSPYGEAGSGEYSRATRGCFDVMRRITPLVLDGAERALDSRKRAGIADKLPFRIADFGTADAGTSLPLVIAVAQRVREAEPSAPIEILYEDQPGNDWSSLFAHTQGALRPEGARSAIEQSGGGLEAIENCFVLASGRSFYSPCFSPGSVDLTFSSTAMHWLQSAPVEIPGALHSACLPTAGSTPEAAAAARSFAAQADRDWRQILAARAAELRPGGQLVVANFAVDEGGQFLGRTGRCARSMHDEFARIWRSIVEPEEFRATNFPNQYRTLEECLGPFTGGEEAYRGLSVRSAETAVVPCPFLDAWLAGKLGRGAEAARAHAQQYVGTTRTWSNSTFLAGLNVELRPSEAERTAKVDELFRLYEEAVAMAPDDHGMDYVHAYIAMEKEERDMLGFFL